MKAWSHWLGSVEELAPGSSPEIARTPPCGVVPNALACLMASPERSTPGFLAYQMRNRPSKRLSPIRPAFWLPESEVAAIYSLRPGS
jgi:hypothetical protein